MAEFNKKCSAMAIRGAGMILFSDFDDEDEPKPQITIQNYAEEIVPRMLDCQFKANFRMFPDTFDVICRYLSGFSDESNTRLEIPIDKQLMVSIWYLANAETFRTVASRFGLRRSSCFFILYRTCRRLMKINVQRGIIKWPTESEQRSTAIGFTKFPGVIGAIDGCHLKILAPKKCPSSYINRKGYHSVLLQGICNDKKKFIDCYVGEVGSVHDATMLKRSPIYNNIVEGTCTIPEDLHILGDSAYPLLNFLLTPYKNNGHLNQNQKKYNIYLSKSRVRIENTFGIMKSRFRRLKLIENRRMDYIVIVIMTCCYLHNICMDMDDEVEIDVDILHDQIELPSNDITQTVARNKRNLICNSL